MQTHERQQRLKHGKVAIAGLGGLGSNIAVMLARIGVGELFLVDFDKVEISNLNRQHYNTSHLGLLKAHCLQEQIKLINPLVKTRISTQKVTHENVRELFCDYPIICEAFDCPKSKAMLVNAVLERYDETAAVVVAGSGMAGMGSANTITTVRKMRGLYLCGDSLESGESGESGDEGFFAPRVSICAGHQANMVARLLLGLEEV
jgi:sulfur carrier protein ThiS adenylyltransferase